MLNIYKSTNIKKEEQIKPESVKVKAFIVSLDIIASETLKLMRLTLQSEVLLSIMKKFMLLRSKIKT